jgi:hypothetical protein
MNSHMGGQLAKEVAKLQTLEYKLVRGVVERVPTSLEGMTEALVGDMKRVEVKSDLSKEQILSRGMGPKQNRFLEDYIIKTKPRGVRE